MFTGLIETIGTVKSFSKGNFGMKLAISSNLKELKIGDSIAVNGVCQTVVNLFDNVFEVEVMQETLRLTNFEFLKINDEVNLERAMRADGRFDGHIVSGHTEGTAEVVNFRQEGFSNVLGFKYPVKYIIKKGSVSLNGVSLTVSDVRDDYFEVSLIPHTIQNTNLKDIKIGDFVNVEVDILAKYVEKFMCGNKDKNGITEDFLREHGFDV